VDDAADDPAVYAMASIAVIAAAWLGAALLAFTVLHLWLPVAVPFLVQIPLALVGGLLWQYLSARREEYNAIQAIRYYLPEQAVRDLARDPANPGVARNLVFGTCVSSDAARFTTLAEGMAPRDLADLLDGYFEALFDPIQRTGGIVIDVAGDGIMSVWAGEKPDLGLRAKAVTGAMEMSAAAIDFGQRPLGHPMPTRIGLHAGWIMIGNVGGKGHFSWRVVGDIPNTASRIEGLNKHLRTRILASAEVVAGLEGILTRRVGRFRLMGKAEDLDIHEIIGLLSDATPSQFRLAALFAEALEACEANHLEEAGKAFRRVLDEFPSDGPTRFHLDRCLLHCAGIRILDDAGIVRLEAK
jgi:adenylate cyclase